MRLSSLPVVRRGQTASPDLGGAWLARVLKQQRRDLGKRNGGVSKIRRPSREVHRQSPSPSFLQSLENGLHPVCGCKGFAQDMGVLTQHPNTCCIVVEGQRLAHTPSSGCSAQYNLLSILVTDPPGGDGSITLHPGLWC